MPSEDFALAGDLVLVGCALAGDHVRRKVEDLLTVVLGETLSQREGELAEMQGKFG